MSVELQSDERLDVVNDNLSLIQKKNGHAFGTDALLLAAFVRGRRRGRALEFGGGGGIVSLLCAGRGKFAHITCVEVRPEYAALAERNIALNGLQARVRAVCADIRELDTYGQEGDYHAVFANPPYMKTDTGKPNRAAGKNAARHETRGGIADFCHAAAKKLRYGGSFFCVWRPDRLADLMRALDAAQLEVKKMTFVCADTQKPPSMVLVEARLGGGGGLVLTRNLFLYRAPGERVYSDEMAYILHSGSFPSEREGV